MRNIRGITLIALIITIIILLILTGITINLTIGEHGILNMAKEAGKNYQNSAEYERTALKDFFNEAENIINGENATGSNPGGSDKPEDQVGPWLLAKKVKVGDFVAYDPTAGVTDTSKLTYISQKGTGMSHGNGYGTQTFTARAYDSSNSATTRWRVLSTNPETGEVVLTAEKGLMSDNKDYFYLDGGVGYLYMEEELNLISAIYGYGKGADTSKTFNYQTGDIYEGLTTGTITGSGARSINIEDVNQITGYTPTKITNSRIDEVFYPTKTTETGHSKNASFREDKTTEYSYDVSTYIDTNDPLFSVITESQYHKFWFASRSVNHDGASVYWQGMCTSAGRVTFIQLGRGMWNEFKNEGGNVNSACGVKPIVYLKATIKTSGQDESGAWNIIDE